MIFRDLWDLFKAKKLHNSLYTRVIKEFLKRSSLYAYFFFDMLPSLLWYTESDKMIGDQDEKDSFSIFRLPVRFSRGWKPSV